MVDWVVEKNNKARESNRSYPSAGDESRSPDPVGREPYKPSSSLLSLPWEDSGRKTTRQNEPHLHGLKNVFPLLPALLQLRRRWVRGR